MSLYRMAYVNRRTGTVDSLSPPDTEKRILTMIGKYQGIYSPITSVRIVPEGCKVGDMAHDVQKYGHIPGIYN